MYLVNEKKVTPVIILDEAQYLRNDIFNDLKMLLNFDMDSKDLAILILLRQPMLNDILSRNIHEALNQRIIVNYVFLGMTPEEVKEYIFNRFKLAGINKATTQRCSLSHLASNSNGSIRRLNLLIKKCLAHCSSKEESIITANTVMLAHNDIRLV